MFRLLILTLAEKNLRGEMDLVRAKLVLILVSVALSGCNSKSKTEDSKAANWAGKMQSLAADVRELVPYIYSRQAFFDPQNSGRIKSGLKDLTKQTHSITPEMAKGFFGNDPLVAYSLEGLQSDFDRSLDAFSMGQVEYSRSVAKSAINHCFRCHSVSKEASQGVAPSWDLTPSQLSGLSSLERIDLLVAGRRYEEATQALESLMIDKDFIQNSPFDFEAALRKYLSLMIRAENNPDRPLKELDRILETKGIPFYVAEQARAWRNSLLEWKKRKPAKKSIKTSFVQARAHIARAQDIQQYAKDHAGDVEYLRATDLIHEVLRTIKEPKQMADAYLLLGQAYEVLDELGYWNLHERYYEACITTLPHSDLARKCYGRLEASVYMGFSGSSGVHIPPNEKLRLVRLQGLVNK